MRRKFFTTSLTGTFRIPTNSQLTKSFIHFEKILIAAVNGPAIGVAATPLALCDFVYAA
jgi:enoyl-CoA hydratase/carnithine racemase